MARTTKTSTNSSTPYTRTFSQTTLGFVAAIGFIVGLSQSASAQDAQVAKPQEIFQDQQNRDPFSNRGSDQAGGVMDLVHRAMQAGSLSGEDFQNQQQENLDSATADFRAAQQKRIGSSPTAPAIAPTTSAPVK